MERASDFGSEGCGFNSRQDLTIKTIHLKNFIVCDPLSPFNTKKVSLFIVNGIIQEKAPPPYFTIDGKNSCLLIPALFDIATFTYFPSQQSIQSPEFLTKALLNGGHSNSLIIPQVYLNDNLLETFKSIQSIIKPFENEYPLTFHIASPLLKNKFNLNDFFLLFREGCSAFFIALTENTPIYTLYHALRYIKELQAKVIIFPISQKSYKDFYGYESTITLQLGLPSLPIFMENSIINKIYPILKDLELKVMICGIHTPQAIELIKKEKRKEILIASPWFNFLWDEEAYLSLNSKYKTFPFLLPKKEYEKLKNLLWENHIDAIISLHEEFIDVDKDQEFASAKPGLSVHPYLISILFTHLANKDISIFSSIIDKVSHNPREFLTNEKYPIDFNYPAYLTIFDPNEEILCKTKWNPFFEQKIYGKVKGIIKKNKIYLNDNES